MSELLDRISIDQIKQLLTGKNKDSVSGEIRDLLHDIDVLIGQYNIKPSARLIRLLIVLAQINLHIWRAKQIMMQEPGQFESQMVLSHQLNGIRNQVKNALLEETGFKDAAVKKTNIGTDNLDGWHFSL
jgi:hypothetical protein